MKNIKLCAFAGALCVFVILSAACGRSTLPQFGHAIADWQAEDRAPDSPQPSQIDKCDSPGELGEYLGFDIAAWPEGGGLSLEAVYAVDGRIAQLEYAAPEGRVLVLRAAFADVDLAATYHEGHGAPESVSADGAEVLVSRGEAGCTMAVWERGDFRYVLHCNGRYEQPTSAEILAFANGTEAERAVN